MNARRKATTVPRDGRRSLLFSPPYLFQAALPKLLNDAAVGDLNLLQGLRERTVSLLLIFDSSWINGTTSF